MYAIIETRKQINKWKNKTKQTKKEKENWTSQGRDKNAEEMKSDLGTVLASISHSSFNTIV